MDPKVMDALRRVRPLADAPEATLNQLAAISVTQKFEPGTEVVRAGDEGDAFYVITGGTARVELETQGKRRNMATLGIGDFFGEVAAIWQQRRSATVIVERPLEVLMFEGAPLRALLDAEPNLRDRFGDVGLERIEADIDPFLDETI